jgi:ankyrin repeat protein
LILAIQENDEKRVEQLLQNGAQPNSEDRYGNHPIHLAMEWDKEHPLHKKRIFFPNIIKLLLKYKANPNARYQFKNATPLHAAVFHYSTDIVIELLYYGAEKEAYNAGKMTSLNLAQHYQYYDIVNILSNTVPPLPIFAIEEEIKSFHLIEIKKTPFIINTSKPFSAKNIIDDYTAL